MRALKFGALHGNPKRLRSQGIKLRDACKHASAQDWMP